MADMNQRERVRQLSIMAYVVMLALIVPLTIVATQKEQEVRTRAAANETPTARPTITPTLAPPVN